MCVYSMVADHYKDKWQGGDYVWPGYGQTIPFSPVGRHEFDELKKQVEEMIALLKRAKKYDEDNDEPDCEMESKIAFLREVAKSVGVDLDSAVLS